MGYMACAILLNEVGTSIIVAWLVQCLGNVMCQRGDRPHTFAFRRMSAKITLLDCAPAGFFRDDFALCIRLLKIPHLTWRTQVLQRMATKT